VDYLLGVSGWVNFLFGFLREPRLIAAELSAAFLAETPATIRLCRFCAA
jgi:hypothetical protein